MASAEGRARWLHYANHCIVQEDYKGGSRPPSSSKSQSESSRDGVKSYDFMTDTKWWLPQQPKDDATAFWEPSWEALEIQEYANIKQLEQKKSTVCSQDDPLLISEKPEKLFSEMESERINKTQPWWRTLDNKQDQCFVPNKGLASLCDLDKLLSATSAEVENMQASGSELSKAELLEALRHSQTRAREAEKAAQEAYNEKEHIITHFLRQASRLFAYKQWLHILQLETTCLQLRNRKYQHLHLHFPDFVPWAPTKGKKHKTPRGKIGKSFRNFLLGLALVGAGLLLGWTLGWLFR